MTLKSLAGVALLGTRRAELPDVPAERAALFETSGNDPEARLLQVAGVAALREAAGRVPPRLARPTPCAAPEDRPRAPRELNSLLAALLDGRSSELLPEALSLLTEAGWRVPEALLPPLLERGRKLFTLRPVLLNAIGETGRWLAAQNPDWRYASPAAETWDGALLEWRSTSTATRQGILYQTRLRDPALGRALLESSWKRETAATTAWMIGGVATGLSMADEPFLEVALDDRSAAVRRKAAELLSTLSASRLCERMTGVAETLLTWTPEKTLEVAFPDPIAPELVRDGVSLRKWKDESKVRSAQLADLLGAVPLAYWQARWNLPPEEVLRAARASRWPAALLKGFALAAERQGNAPWSLALLRQEGVGAATTKLVKNLLPEDLEHLIEALDDGEPISKDSALVKLLGRYPHPWNEALVARFVARLEARLAVTPEDAPGDLALKNATKACARHCPTEAVAELYEALEALSRRYPAWANDLQEALMVASFRARLLRAAREEP